MNVDYQAKEDIEVMLRLRESVLEPSELEKVTGIPMRRLRCILSRLREAGCVFKVRGTHLYALSDR